MGHGTPTRSTFMEMPAVFIACGIENCCGPVRATDVRLDGTRARIVSAAQKPALSCTFPALESWASGVKVRRERGPLYSDHEPTVVSVDGAGGDGVCRTLPLSSNAMSEKMARDKVARLAKEKAGLERDQAKVSDKVASLRKDVARLERDMARTKGGTTLASKQRQIESKLAEVARQQKKHAEIGDKIAKKLVDLARANQDLDREVARSSKKQDEEQRRRHETDKRHAREMARDIPSSLRADVSASMLRRLPDKIKVLFLAANPVDLDQLRLDEEIRSISEKIRAAEYRDSVQLISRWAVRPGDLLQALNEERPHVVHFSGHGSDTEIVFLDPNGKAKPVTKDAITQLIATTGDNMRLIVFNTCYSRDQAEDVTEHVDAAIGMTTSVGDEAARIFSAQFYSSIGFGHSVQKAFDQARTALMLEGIKEEDTPELFTRDGLQADELILVRP